jgi:hypothetical protein
MKHTNKKLNEALLVHALEPNAIDEEMRSLKNRCSESEHNGEERAEIHELAKCRRLVERSTRESHG